MTWVDEFDEHWMVWLRRRYADRRGQRIHLLLDGVFRPGLWGRLSRTVDTSCSAVFGHLGSCPDAVLDVTPVVVEYSPMNQALDTQLSQCNGQPMVTMVETDETAEQLAQRLSRWCVIDASGSAFNFRFPDTRRLPAIAEVLRPAQRANLLGPAIAWYCIVRSGRWMPLPLGRSGDLGEAMQAGPRLDDRQFAALVQDSEADEILSILAPDFDDRQRALRPSRRHEVAQAALKRADADRVTGLADRIQRVADAIESPTAGASA